jgi:outer membrane protein assembly factor BamB
MVYRIVIIFLSFQIISAHTISGQFSQWRGPQRNGIYPDKGLLKAWPEKGPEMLWSYEGLGSGHGNAGLSNDKIFVLGMPDSTGFLYAFDYKGKILWKKEYGPEWHENYTGPRSTPVIAGELVYFESGYGIVFCYNVNTGDKIWSVDLLNRFDSKNITWGMAESLLIEGDILFCTPGGKENNIVALNRFTGETIWTSRGNGQPAAYCSPIYVRHNKTSLIVTMTASSIIGIDALTGQCYWQVPQFQTNKIHANTPVYSEGKIYCSSDYDKSNSGLVALKLSDDGKSVTVEWRNENFQNLMGGIIIKDGYIYGSKFRKKMWSCIDTSDGQILYSSDNIGDGNIIMADGMFYCYSEEGEIALVAANPSSFNVISKFNVPLGTDQHWSHPVISQGILYVRHGNALMAYNLKEK